MPRLRESHEQCESGDRSDTKDDCDGCGDVGGDQAPRRTARLVLSSKKIHRCRYLKGNFRRVAFLLGLYFQEAGELEAEESGNDAIWEILRRVVVAKNRVIERLA